MEGTGSSEDTSGISRDEFVARGNLPCSDFVDPVSIFDESVTKHSVACSSAACRASCAVVFAAIGLFEGCGDPF